MTRLSERIVSLLLVAFLIIYAGYQAYRYYYTPFQTETVFDYTVSQSLAVEGVVLRSETVIDETALGVEHHLFDDGERVSVGQTVAEYYTTASGGQNKRRIRELETEIATLVDAQGGSFTNSDSINREIKDQLTQVAQMSSTGRYDDIDEVRPALATLLNKRHISTGRETDYSARIRALEAELSNLNSVSRGEVAASIKSPASGFFSKSVDGYEGCLNASMVGNSSLAQYLRVIQNPSNVSAPNACGKIITNQNWYYACAVPKYQVEWLWNGQGVTVEFDQSDGRRQVPAVISEIVTEKDYDEAVLVLQCNQVTEDLVSMRYVEASININELWGLRVNAGSVRFQGDQRGVYVLEDGTTVRFRHLDPIYEDQSYVLSRIDEANPELVQMYDLVITKGKDLYDGKHVG